MINESLSSDQDQDKKYNFDNYYDQGIKYFNNKESEKAVESFKMSKDNADFKDITSEQSSNLYYYLGRAHLRWASYEEANIHYEEAYINFKEAQKNTPDSIKILDKLAQVSFIQGKHEEAAKYCQKLINFHSSNPEKLLVTCYNMANILLNIAIDKNITEYEFFKDINKYYQKVLNFENLENKNFLKNELGIVYGRAGEKLGLSKISESLTNNKEIAKSLLLKGQIFARLNKIEYADEIYDIAFKVGGEYTDALIYKNLLDPSKQNNEDFLKIYEEALKIDPNCLMARLGKADILRQMNKLKEAERSYEIAKKLHDKLLTAFDHDACIDKIKILKRLIELSASKKNSKKYFDELIEIFQKIPDQNKDLKSFFTEDLKSGSKLATYLREYFVCEDLKINNALPFVVYNSPYDIEAELIGEEIKPPKTCEIC